MVVNLLNVVGAGIYREGPEKTMRLKICVVRLIRASG